MATPLKPPPASLDPVFMLWQLSSCFFTAPGFVTDRIWREAVI
jgi:hypothetical protein